MKKSSIGVYFTGLLGPWISGINRVLTDSTSFLQTCVTNAQLSAQDASVSKASASQSVLDAQSFADAASQSLSQAQDSANQAAISLQAVQAILKAMNAEWLGVYDKDPTVDASGNAIVNNAVYYNSATNKIRIYENGKFIDADQSVQDALQNAINAAGQASASASAAQASATNSENSAEDSEYWATLSKQYAQNVANMAAPISAALAGKYVRINADGTQYQYDTPAQVLQAIQAAPLLSPVLQGIPTVPTALLGTATQQAASCAFVLNQASATIPPMNSSSGRIGTSLRYAREDHCHATDTTRAALNGRIDQVFRASCFLASWGAGGSGFTFDADGANDSGMFSIYDGLVYFLANNVRTLEFDTYSVRSTIPFVAQKAITANTNLSLTDTTKSNTGYASFYYDATTGDTPNLYLKFGAGIANTTTNGKYTGTVKFTPTGDLALSGNLTATGATLSGSIVGGQNQIELGVGENPTIYQGTFHTWGDGVTNVINFKGTGTGGFKWYNSTPSEWKNTSDTTNLWLLSLDASGNLTSKGTVTANAISATKSISTLYGLSVRANVPTVNFFIGQQINPSACITLDTNGGFHITNSPSTSDGLDRFVTDYTYFTAWYGSQTSRAVLSGQADGTLTIADKSGNIYSSFSANGFIFNKPVILNDGGNQARFSGTTYKDLNISGTQYTYNGWGPSITSGSNSAALLGDTFLAPTLLGVNGVIGPIFTAGLGSNLGFSFYGNLGSLSVDANQKLNLVYKSAVGISLSGTGVETLVPALFSADATFTKNLSTTLLSSPSGIITSSSEIKTYGAGDAGSRYASPKMGTDNRSGTYFGLSALYDSSNGSVGALYVAETNGNNWHTFEFHKDAILMPNGSSVIHSDNAKVGQTIGGTLSVLGGISTASDISGWNTSGGTGPNGSVRPKDLISGTRYSSSVYSSGSLITSTFSARDISGDHSYASIIHRGSDNSSHEWAFNQSGVFVTPGDISVHGGSTVYTDYIGGSSGNNTTFNGNVTMNYGNAIYLNGAGGTSGTSGDFNYSSAIRMTISQRNNNFTGTMWTEEHVGDVIQTVINVTNGSDNKYFHFKSNGTFRADFVDSTAASSKYSDYAENYQSRAQSIKEGHIVRIATQQDVDAGLVEDGDEVALADIAGGYYFAVVSTAPGYLINSEQEYGKPIALTGRVPVYVFGKVSRGQAVSLSNTPGVGCVSDDHIIGFALESSDDEGIKKVMIALGGRKL